MTKKDIDDIISVICPNDEDFEKLIISPAYLKKELEVLALEQEPSGDLISRQKLLEDLYKRDYTKFTHRDFVALVQYQDTVQQEPCDAISRKAAIDAMYNLCDTEETLRENPWRDNPHIDAIIDVIGDLPSVAPLKKVGKWIAVENEEMETIGYYCSECDLPMETEQRTKFCPNCGAKMETKEP